MALAAREASAPSVLSGYKIWQIILAAVVFQIKCWCDTKSQFRL